MSEGHRCEICGVVETNGDLISQCFGCQRDFHLNPRSDTEGIDCGDALIGPALGIEFYCQDCIAMVEGRSAAQLADQDAPPGASPTAPAITPPTTPTTAPTITPPTTPTTTPPTAPRSDLPPRRATGPPRRRYRRIDRE